MTHREFEDWLTAYAVDPWGEDRADLRMRRQVWAALQPHSKRRLREDRFGFDFTPREPPGPEAYRLKSMRAYALLAAAFERRERHP